MKGGTKVYCPYCQSFELCRAVRSTEVGEKGWQRMYFVGHKDVSFFNRARLCKKCNRTFLSAEVSQFLLEELVAQRNRGKAKNKRMVNKLKRELEVYDPKYKFSKEFAQGFITRTAHWDHPSGQLVSAPNHSENVYGSIESGWKIDFGANTFLISKAALKCKEEALRILEDIMEGGLVHKELLMSSFIKNIRASVVNTNGGAFKHYPITRDYMMFGTQLIDVKYGAEYLIERFMLANFFVK